MKFSVEIPQSIHKFHGKVSHFSFLTFQWAIFVWHQLLPAFGSCWWSKTHSSSMCKRINISEQEGRWKKSQQKKRSVARCKFMILPAILNTKELRLFYILLPTISCATRNGSSEDGLVDGECFIVLIRLLVWQKYEKCGNFFSCQRKTIFQNLLPIFPNSFFKETYFSNGFKKTEIH